jgi:DNA-binding MurR/RpiR family transcriptional regulator
MYDILFLKGFVFMVDIDETKDLMKNIELKFQRLSKGQKLIAEYILEHYDKAAFMTAAKIGVSVGVSESTVVRFANELGYDGYPKLQKALQELIKNKLTTVQRMELSTDLINENSALKNVLKSDMDNIRTTLETIDIKTFENVIESIFNAKRIYIIGLRSSMALAEFLGFYLNTMLDNVRILSYGVSDIFDQIISLNENDLVIGIGFPRYANQTIEVLDFAQSRNAKVVAITDSYLSPLATRANYTLTAQSNMASFVDSLVAPMSVINALIITVGLQEKEKMYSVFSKLENIWQEYNIYSYKSIYEDK